MMWRHDLISCLYCVLQVIKRTNSPPPHLYPQHQHHRHSGRQCFLSSLPSLPSLSVPSFPICAYNRRAQSCESLSTSRNGVLIVCNLSRHDRKKAFVAARLSSQPRLGHDSVTIQSAFSHIQSRSRPAFRQTLANPAWPSGLLAPSIVLDEFSGKNSPNSAT